MGAANNWDAHGDIGNPSLARNVDQPIAALIRDLKQRGLLDETLVVWTTEFGRTPYHEKADHPGREHHHQVFSSWMAGGGVKPGIAYGASDEYGVVVAENRVHVHDFHATILNLMGITITGADLSTCGSRLSLDGCAWRSGNVDHRLAGECKWLMQKIDHRPDRQFACVLPVGDGAGRC